MNEERQNFDAKQGGGDCESRIVEGGGQVDDGQEQGAKEEADDGDVDEEHRDLYPQRVAEIVPDFLEEEKEGEVYARQDDDGVGKAGSNQALLTFVKEQGKPEDKEKENDKEKDKEKHKEKHKEKDKEKDKEKGKEKDKDKDKEK